MHSLILVVTLTLPALLPLAAAAVGDCNVCKTSNMACVSRTQFQLCVASLTVGEPYDCPSNYVCSTIGDSICQPNQANVSPDCSNCNKCDATNTFACTGTQTYALCLGTNQPSPITGSCAPSHICNIGNPQICGTPATGTVPTCSFTDDVTTSTPTTSSTSTTLATTVAPTDPNTICRTLQRVGRFPYGSDLNTTCKQYVYCCKKSGVWYGELYQCPGSTYFDSSTRNCGNKIPARCYGTVTRLAIADIALE